MNNMTESQLFAVAVPQKTDTYSPVSHKNIIEAIQEEADKRGLEIRNKHYWGSREGTQLTGKFDIVVPGDDELGMMTAFRNSYDKSMSIGFAAGGNVWICTNGQVAGDITLVRRHTGGVVQEIAEKISVSMDQLEDEFKKLQKQNARMKDVTMTKTEMAELAGKLFVEEELLNTTQLNIMKKEILTSENFGDENLWCAYNHVTEAFKKTNAYDYIPNHIELHKYFEREFEDALIVE